MSFDFGYHFGFRLGSDTPTPPPPPPPPPDPDFVMLVKTDNTGTSGTNQFTIPTVGGGPASGYNYTVTTSEQTLTNQNGGVTLTWATAGTYEVRISGTFPRIFFNNGGDRLKLVETVNFGSVGWTSMERAFWGCSNNVINTNATGNFDLVTSCNNAWANNNLNFFPKIDMPICANISGAWHNNANLNTFPLIDLSSVTVAGSATSLGGSGAWSFTNIANFPQIDMPICTNITFTWLSANIINFPEINLQSVTNATGAWRANGVIASFATRNFYAMNNGSNCFQNTTLPTSDYSDILVTQRANNNNNNVTFHGGGSKYNTAGGVARAELTDLVANGGQAWAITDGGAE